MPSEKQSLWPLHIPAPHWSQIYPCSSFLSSSFHSMQAEPVSWALSAIIYRSLSFIKLGYLHLGSGKSILASIYLHYNPYSGSLSETLYSFTHLVLDLSSVSFLHRVSQLSQTMREKLDLEIKLADSLQNLMDGAVAGTWNVFSSLKNRDNVEPLFCFISCQTSCSHLICPTFPANAALPLPWWSPHAIYNILLFVTLQKFHQFLQPTKIRAVNTLCKISF